MAKNNQKTIEDAVKQTAERIDEIIGFSEDKKESYIEKWAERKANEIIKFRENLGFEAVIQLDNLRIEENRLSKQCVKQVEELPEKYEDPIKDALVRTVIIPEVKEKLIKVRKKIETLNGLLNNATFSKNNKAVWDNLDKYLKTIKDT